MHHTIFNILVGVLCVYYHGAVGLLGPLLSLLWCSNFWSGVYPVRFLENFRKHTVELGFSLLTLVYGRLCESASRSMKYVRS